MTLTAVLFVGGLSSRMGTDKALLEISGQPLWARQLDMLGQLKLDVLWISGRAKPSWCPPMVEMIPDVAPSQGPLSGLVAVLEKVQTSHLLVLAIDLPQMTVELLLKFRSLAQSGCGVVPQNDRGFEPLCAIYPREAASAARAALEAGELSLQRLVAVLLREKLVQVYPVPASEQSCFLNVNSPAELETFRAQIPR